MAQKSKPRITIVSPVYNEEKRIEASLKKIYEFMEMQNYSYEIIVSDDGSTDRTKEIVRQYKKEWEELKLLENPHKGKAPAIISGINKAQGENVLFTDIDLSVSIDEIPKMLTWVENQDFEVAIATREGIGAKRIGEPYMRHLMGRIFNLLVQIMILPGINDTQCGFKMFETNAAKEIFKKSKLYSADDPEITGAKVSGFDVELLYIAQKLGYRIKEVPVIWTYGDDSKVHGLKDSYNNAMDVFKVRLNSFRGEYSK